MIAWLEIRLHPRTTKSGTSCEWSALSIEEVPRVRIAHHTRSWSESWNVKFCHKISFILGYRCSSRLYFHTGWPFLESMSNSYLHNLYTTVTSPFPWNCANPLFSCHFHYVSIQWKCGWRMQPRCRHALSIMVFCPSIEHQWLLGEVTSRRRHVREPERHFQVWTYVSCRVFVSITLLLPWALALFDWQVKTFAKDRAISSQS